MGRTVDVTRMRTFVTEGRSEHVPFDLGGADLLAVVTDDAGQRVIYPDVTGPGTGTFAGMPPGPYFLALNDYNLVTDANQLDLGVLNLGRSSVQLSDGGGVELRLDVSGLMPWQPFSDVLQLTAESAGYVAVNAQSYSPQPDAGSSDAGFGIAYWAACSTQRSRLAPLIDADAGDRLTVTQLASAAVGDAGLLELRTLVRAATLPPFSMEDGRATQLTAALAPAATQERVSLDYRQSAFDALRAAVHPSATAISSTVTVTALPFTAAHGAYTAAPDLAVLRPQQLSSDVALTFDTGNPFPATWPKVITARFAVQVNVQYPDGGARALTTALVTQELATSLDGGPLGPRVGPPRNVRVDGADGLVRAQISRRPLITWDASALGTPTSYAVTVFRFSRVGGGPVIAVAEEGLFETTERSLRVPFGDVTPGQEYVFAVTAFDAPGSNVAAAPFKGGFPFGSATALTTLLRVDPALMP